MPLFNLIAHERKVQHIELITRRETPYFPAPMCYFAYYVNNNSFKQDFEDFTNISDYPRRISKDRPKLTGTFSNFFRALPKKFKGDPKKFRLYTNK